MFCQKCGNQLNVNESYCGSCGTPVELQPQPQSYQSQQQNYQQQQVNFQSQPQYNQQSKVSNVLVWILAFLPLIGIFFEFGFVVFVIVNVILCYIDQNNLVKAGYNTEELGNTWLIPSYLHKRAKMLNQSIAYMVVWCITFVISIGIPFM